MIVITSKREGFRRCGVAHAARPVEWPDERWTIDELDALLAEPMLTVEVVEDPAAPPALAALMAEPMLTVEVVEDPAAPPAPAAPEPYEMELDVLEPAPAPKPVEVVEDPAAQPAPAAPEPYEMEFDVLEPAPAPKKAGRKK